MFQLRKKRACKSCLDLISQKKTSSTDINMLKRKPPNQYHQMLPYYERVYEPKQNNIDFESAREILGKEDDKMVVQRRFERIFNMMMDCKSYKKTKKFLKTKRYLFMNSNMLKQIKSITIS